MNQTLRPAAREESTGPPQRSDHRIVQTTPISVAPLPMTSALISGVRLLKMLLHKLEITPDILADLVRNNWPKHFCCKLWDRQIGCNGFLIVDLRFITQSTTNHLTFCTHRLGIYRFPHNRRIILTRVTNRINTLKLYPLFTLFTKRPFPDARLDFLGLVKLRQTNTQLLGLRKKLNNTRNRRINYQRLLCCTFDPGHAHASC